MTTQSHLKLKTALTRVDFFLPILVLSITVNLDTLIYFKHLYISSENHCFNVLGFFYSSFVTRVLGKGEEEKRGDGEVK